MSLLTEGKVVLPETEALWHTYKPLIINYMYSPLNVKVLSIIKVPLVQVKGDLIKSDPNVGAKLQTRLAPLFPVGDFWYVGISNHESRPLRDRRPPLPDLNQVCSLEVSHRCCLAHQTLDSTDRDSSGQRCF